MDDVDEERIAFENHCLALVSSRKYESFLRRLLQTPAGTWTPLQALAVAAPPYANGTASNAWASWSPAPTPEDGSFVVIVFYDFSANMSLVAYSNRARLNLPGTPINT